MPISIFPPARPLRGRGGADVSLYALCAHPKQIGVHRKQDMDLLRDVLPKFKTLVYGSLGFSATNNHWNVKLIF